MQYRSIQFLIAASFFAVLLNSFAVRADTIVTRDAKHIYFKTPYRELSSHARTAATRDSLQAVIETLKESIPNEDNRLERMGKIATLNALQAAYPRLDDLMKVLNQYMKTGRKIPFLQQIINRRPTAFIINIGVSGDTGIGWSGTIGLVILPTKVDRINMITKEVDHYMEYDTNWIVWPNLDIKVQTAAKIKYRFGLGVIFGDLEKAEDFVGGAFGGSWSIGKWIMGINVKAGVLLQPKPRNFYITANLEVGPEMSVGLKLPHLNAAVIANASKVLNALVPNGGQINPTDYQPPPEEQEEHENVLLAQVEKMDLTAVPLEDEVEIEPIRFDEEDEPEVIDDSEKEMIAAAIHQFSLQGVESASSPSMNWGPIVSGRRLQNF